VISVLAVAGDKLAAAQITERKVLNASEITLTQQRYHSMFSTDLFVRITSTDPIIAPLGIPRERARPAEPGPTNRSPFAGSFPCSGVSFSVRPLVTNGYLEVGVAAEIIQAKLHPLSS